MKKQASTLLHTAANLIDSRGKERDNAGERSMERTVEAFNLMTGHQLSEEDGWQFMVFLKFARMRGGCFKQDDYEDAIAYTALQAEAAIEANVMNNALGSMDHMLVNHGDVHDDYLYDMDKVES